MPNQYLTYDEAIQAIDRGYKVKLPEWTGYWFKEDAIIKVFTRTGDILETPFFEKYENRNDWEITDGNMGFDFAALALKNNKKVSRRKWLQNESLPQWMKLQHPDVNSKMTKPYLYARIVGDLLPW